MLGAHMEREIREQPDILSRGVSSYFGSLKEMLGAARFELAVLVARGSSDHAALYARYLIEIHLGIPVSLAAPSVLTRYGRRLRYPKTLAIGISQSGASPDVADVLAALREDGHATLAITNTPGSRITDAAQHALLLETGPEQSVAATKTYSASLLAIYELVRALGAEIPPPSVPGDDWLEKSRLAAESGVGQMLRSSILFSLARGYSFATAQETALKLMECALLPCKAYSSADFEHGPRALARHGTAAVVYGEPLPFLKDQGAEVVLAPSSVEGPCSPIWDGFFAQWLALLCARSRGLDPDNPAHIVKVTETL